MTAPLAVLTAPLRGEGELVLEGALAVSTGWDSGRSSPPRVSSSLMSDANRTHTYPETPGVGLSVPTYVCLCLLLPGMLPQLSFPANRFCPETPAQSLSECLPWPPAPVPRLTLMCISRLHPCLFAHLAYSLGSSRTDHLTLLSAPWHPKGENGGRSRNAG